MNELHIDRDQFLELQKIGIGAFAPIKGFMNEEDFLSVVKFLKLKNGEIFPLPVYLDISKEDADRLNGAGRVVLTYNNEAVGEIEPQDFFVWDKQAAAQKVFGMLSENHPGVMRMLRAKDWLVGGTVKLYPAGHSFLFADELSPQQSKEYFSKMGWKKIAGFQTRNVPHRAHEYLQRIALEVCDGLFVQPLLGHKKAGDYTPEAVMKSYRCLTSEFLPRERVLLGVLSTAMRYAGPREALFHALIRRNYGCTHFIVGRDHAGVGSFYGKYEAQQLALQYSRELGIEILALKGPFYCSICDGIATEHTCTHAKRHPNAVTEISGTLMRQILRESAIPRPELMRREVVESLHNTPIFID